MFDYRYTLLITILVINMSACSNMALSPDQLKYMQYSNDININTNKDNPEEAARISELKLNHARDNFKNSELYYLSLHETQQLLSKVGKFAEASKLYEEEIMSQSTADDKKAILDYANTVLANSFNVVKGNKRNAAITNYIIFLADNNFNTDQIDSYLSLIISDDELSTAEYLFDIIEAIKISKEMPDELKNLLIKKAENHALKIYNSKLQTILTNSNDVKYLSKAGRSFMFQKDYSTAEKCFLRIVEIENGLADDSGYRSFINAVGLISYITEHKLPPLMEAVNMLAKCYYMQGKKAEVYELYKHYSTNIKLKLSFNDIKEMAAADDIYKTVKENPANILYYDDFADIFWGLNDVQLALNTYKMSSKLSFDSMNFIYSAFLPEELRTSTVDMRQPFNRLINFAYKVNNHQSVSDAFEAWANYKGYMVSFDKERWNAIERFNDKKINKTFGEYLNAKRKLSGFTFAQIIKHEELQETLQSKARSEMELSKLLSSYTSQLIPWMQLNDIKKRIPKNSTYIDFAKVSEFNEQLLVGENFAYYAFVIKQESNNIELVRVGSCEHIDSIINDYRRLINNASKQHQVPSEAKLKELSQNLYDSIYKPLKQYVNGGTEIIVSPDGALNVFPFEILSDGGKYLYETKSISYLPTIRDAKQQETEQKLNSDVVIFSDPDFDIDNNHLHDNISTTMRNNSLLRLTDTAIEAKNIASVFSENFKIKLFTGKEATEQNLFSIQHPEVLHIATHGFYEQNNSDLKASQRSGLYLARANTGIQSGNRGAAGIMTAEKIAWLPLKGTKMVSLSACSTGVGDTKDSEGVFGLQRAFLSSGASSLLVSLWDVPSKETTELMSEFYKQWSSGLNKSQALAKAKYLMARSNTNPYYWASFILVGQSQ